MNRLIILFLFIPILSYSQTNKWEKIEETAKKISGLWMLISYKNDSVENVQKVINGNYWEIKKKSGIITDSICKKGFNVIEFSLNEVGRGEYQEYSNYKTLNKDQDDTEIETCQPSPELRIKNDTMVIHFTYMLGEEEENIIELTDSKLVLGNNKQKRIYQKIK